MRHLAHIVLCGLVLTANTACQNSERRLPVIGGADHAVPAFTLIDQSGNESGSNKLQEAVFVADFIFTRCPSICPKMTATMKQIQQAFADEPEVKLVSFTVDPKHDSASVLALYMEHFGANPDVWTMYTGEKKDLYNLARSGFLVTAVEGDGGPTDFIHSDKLVLVDKQSRIRGQYNGTKPESADQLIADIRLLLKEND